MPKIVLVAAVEAAALGLVVYLIDSSRAWVAIAMFASWIAISILRETLLSRLRRRRRRHDQYSEEH